MRNTGTSTFRPDMTKEEQAKDFGHCMEDREVIPSSAVLFPAHN